MEKVVILSGTRSPIGKYKGALKGFSAVELGTKIASAALERAGISPDNINQSIIGNVLGAGNGQNIARQIAINSGIPASSPAMTINEVCGSGMKAVILAMQQIQLGQAQVVLAGGTESMTQAPLLQKYQAATDTYEEPISSMINDGLTDAFSQQHMGLTAEKVAETFEISRTDQDAFAFHSQQKAAAARAAGKFTAEITSITLADGTKLAQDEGIREHTTLEKLGTLRTVFKENGSVTAGNASTLNDGAAMLVLASESYAKAHGLNYLATIEGYSEIGIDPSIMGVAPIMALQTLTDKTQTALADIELFEINEAFAASSLAVEKELELPAEKINIYGGGISLGHPIGASGARILVTLLAELFQENKTLGAASLCVGGGLGLAVLIKKKTEQTPSQKKFYQQSRSERLETLVNEKFLSLESAKVLEQEQLLDSDVANQVIENQIGEAELPIGVAQNFLINGQRYVIPMVTEEPSVIAAASNAAKIIGQSGGFETMTTTRIMRGQIVFQEVAQPEKFTAQLVAKKDSLLELSKEIYPSIVTRGGGVRDIQWRTLENFVSLDILVDTKDAMGANMINTILEGLAQQLREWFPDETILFSILSNFPTEALSIARCRIPVAQLATKDFSGQLVAEKIVLASRYAQLDPYRAATHNKGIMNGIEAVVLATGNDTRAVAAGIHAYASRNGSYQGLTTWQLADDFLVGSLEIPVAVGTVGGATKVFPKAQIAMELLRHPQAKELAEIITAVGLGQNLAAVKALVTEGIQKGHMNLHMRQLAISAGAKGAEIALLTQKLQTEKNRNLALAQALLTELRKP